MTAISPQDWQDQEDGRALRELREALPGEMSERYIRVQFSERHGVHVFAPGAHFSEGYPTIAAAADACRAALRERAP